VPYNSGVEAYGSDGHLVANDSHVTISWKTLRGRLSSAEGASLEVIPISRIYEVILIPATDTRKGCIQLHLIGNPDSVNAEINWMSSLHKGILTHAVMFKLPEQFQFKALADHIQDRIIQLRNASPRDDFGSGLASGE
jgi:hypothetical protein